jgi:hypothetical protein
MDIITVDGEANAAVCEVDAQDLANHGMVRRGECR